MPSVNIIIMRSYNLLANIKEQQKYLLRRKSTNDEGGSNTEVGRLVISNLRPVQN